MSGYDYAQYNQPPPAHPAPYGQYGHSSQPAPTASSDAQALAAARAEIASLKAENAALKAENAVLKGAGAASAPPMVPPPQFYPPPFGPGGYPGAYGMPYGGAGGYPGAYGSTAPPQPQPAPRPATLPMNAENKRGPKGANLALFCIPNAYSDQQVYDLAVPYGAPIFAQVATHRDTGASRGYAFVSFGTIEEADKAIAGLHNMVIEGRSLRCELTRTDKEGSSGSGHKPY